MKYAAYRLAGLFLLVAGFLCMPFTKSFAQGNTIEQYIQKYKNIAEEEMQRTGVPAAISLAQGILESQAGQGWLVEHSHNHFGIKCKANWSGQTIFYDDDHKNECFRVYETDDSSWRDHSDFLRYSPRYAFLFQLDPLDYEAWAHGLKKAGYATNRAYARQLIEYIEKYNLQQYSENVLAGKTDQPVNTFAGMLEKKISNDRRQSGIIENNPSPVLTENNAVSSYPSGKFEINGRKAVYLPQGTQLIAIAHKYHIRLTRLLHYNELESDVLPEDQLIYLQKKRKKGFFYQLAHLFSGNKSRNTAGTTGRTAEAMAVSEKTGVKKDTPKPIHETKEIVYQVKPGDTLYGLSQKYSITVEQIKQWNNLQSDRIQAGQQLIIKQ